jgi:hypothetical protein
MSLPAALGWGHRGFRVASRPAAWLGLLAVLAIPFALDLHRAATRGMGDRYSDLVIWYEAAADLRSHQDQPLYQRHPKYLYPPLLVTLFAPLTALPPSVATVIYQLCKWAALVIALRLAWRLAGPVGEDLPPIVTLGSLLLTARFFENDFSIANINTFVLCGVLLAALLARRVPTHFLAGVIVGVLTGIKLTPALVLAYFIYKGWWRTLVGAAVGVILALLVVPALLIGWENNLRLLGDWFHHLPGAFAAGTIRSTHTNQSITAIVNRLFGGSSAIPAGDGGASTAVYITLVTLPPWARDVIRFSLSSCILAALAWVCRRRFQPLESPLRYAAEVSLVLIAMLALSGMSWKAHFVALLPAFSVLLAYLADARYPDSPRRAIAFFLIAAAALCILTSDIITPIGADYAESFGLVLLGALLAAAGVWTVHSGLASPPRAATTA